MFCTLQSYTFNFIKCETQVIWKATNVHRFSLILLISETLKLQKPKRPSATKTFNPQKPYSYKDLLSLPWKTPASVQPSPPHHPHWTNLLSPFHLWKSLIHVQNFKKFYSLQATSGLWSTGFLIPITVRFFTQLICIWKLIYIFYGDICTRWSEKYLKFTYGSTFCSLPPLEYEFFTIKKKL